jgi:hypothetical protein
VARAVLGNVLPAGAVAHQRADASARLVEEARDASRHRSAVTRWCQPVYGSGQRDGGVAIAASASFAGGSLASPLT